MPRQVLVQDYSQTSSGKHKFPMDFYANVDNFIINTVMNWTHMNKPDLWEQWLFL